ncbi:MAG: OmpA family protein [Weeksellaceae bacterium]|jgi:outer membrane protein OmpA-like peptidoglycan-associated protein
MKFQKGFTAIVLGTAFLITSCKCEKKDAVSSHAEDSATTMMPAVADDADNAMVSANLDADGNYIYNVGNLFDLNLPDGTRLSVGENSSENKIYKMLSDSGFTVSDDKTQGWVTLDRIYFPTGGSDLTGISQAQISNMVALLKAFPDASIKVGGYTDNTGGDDVNLRVSGERAQTVADAIVAAGIDNSRIESEGYGANHFVCPDNDTDECKAQNRRVDVRITQK